MKRFILIRHGQSEDNAGLPSRGLGLAPLTEIGCEQAAIVADILEEKPDLIVSSDFVRAVQTAEPTRKKFPDSSYERWPVEEFRQLGSKRYQGLDMRERGNIYRSHWDRNDPHYADGDGAESLAEMVDRLVEMRNRLMQAEAGLIYLFSHGFFLRSFMALHMLGKPDIIIDNMRMFREMTRSFHIPNCGMIHGAITPEQTILLSPILTDHLPKRKHSY